MCRNTTLRTYIYIRIYVAQNSGNSFITEICLSQNDITSVEKYQIEII